MKNNWLTYCLDEIKLLKSAENVKILIRRKVPLVFSRAFGLPFGSRGGYPKILQIEPTNYCNISCLSCPNHRMQRERGYMDFELFKRVVSSASTAGVIRIQLFLHGEPLLHPQIVDMVKYIKSQSISVALYTNGMLMNEELAESLIRCGLDSGDYIVFSVLGASKLTHEKIMVNVNHEQVVANIKRLLKLRNVQGVSGPIIETIFYRMPENHFEEEQFVEMWRGVVDRVHPIGGVSKSFRSTGKDAKTPMRTKACTMVRERMIVYWNGDVTICNSDVDGRHVVGNLKDRGVREIWDSEPLVNLRTIHRSKRFESLPTICLNCDQ